MKPTDVIGGEITEARADDWGAQCLVCNSRFCVRKEDSPENPAPHGSFCPDCRSRKMAAPGVLHWGLRYETD